MKTQKELSKRVLLISPKIKDEPPFYPPYGLLWIAANLLKNNFRAFIYDRNVDSEDLNQVLKKTKPDIVGISCLTGEVLLDVLTVLKTIKKLDPRIKTVLGGIHVSFFPEISLREETVDFIVRGEGEEAMVELLEKLDYPRKYRRIKGLGYKDEKGGLILNPKREFVKDLNSLPDPAWHLIQVEKYLHRTFFAKRTITLNTSRGCPNRCAFCYNQSYNQRKYRSLSADRVIKQVEGLIKNYKVDGIQFYEDEFDVDPKRVESFCQEIIKRKIKIGWHIGSRVNYATRERFELLKKAGCEEIEFGVESGSPRLLDFLHKDITVEQIKEAFRLAKETGIKADALFMIGLPTETEGELKQTLSLIESLPAFNVISNIYKPYPGTELFEFCVRKYKIKLPLTLEGLARLYNFSSLDLTATDVPVKTLESIQNEMVGKSIIDTIKTCLKEMRFGYLVSIIFQRLKHFRQNKLIFSLVFRMKTKTLGSKSYDRQYYEKQKFGFVTENRPDHKHILDLLGVKAGERVLEIGCGFGVLLKKIPSRRKIGIETNETAIGECRKRGLSVLKADAETKLPFKNASFEIIIMNEVIEHLTKPKIALEECFRILKPKGKIIITTPIKNFFVHDLAETHWSEMTVGELRQLVQESGFKVLSHEVNGISFLYPFFETLFFKPFRLLRYHLGDEQKNKVKLIDSLHGIADKTILNPFSFYRSYWMGIGSNQLILAEKKT